jgi:hypothetical protein
MLECGKIDDIICDIENKDINNIHLRLNLLDTKFKDLYCDQYLFNKIILWLRQYSKSIESHTIETFGDGKKGDARIIFGSYIQLIEDDNGTGTIYKLDNISYEDSEWRNNCTPCIYMPSDENKILISLIKATYDYQQLIKTTGTKEITINTDDGCFTGQLDIPSNVYTLKIDFRDCDIQQKVATSGAANPIIEERRLRNLSEIGYYNPNTCLIYYVKTKPDFDKFKEEVCPHIETRTNDMAN